MSSSTDSASTSSPSEQRDIIAPTEPQHQQQPDAVLSAVKEQVNSATGGRSISEIGTEISSVAGEKVHTAKETVLPVAEEAIHTIQSHIGSLVGSGNAGEDGGQDPAADEAEQQQIDQLDTERVCDFLREKHMSTKPPPLTK